MKNAALKMAEDPDQIHFIEHHVPGNGSSGHAAALKNVVMQADPSYINVVCDSDTVMLMWGWDTMLRVLFASKEADVLGSTY